MSAEVELARLEAAVIGRGEIARWLLATDTLRRLLAMGDEEAVRRILVAMREPVLEAQALAAVLDAFKVGADDAVAILDDVGIAAATRRRRPTAAARAAVKGIDRDGRDALRKAAVLARTGADGATAAAPVLAHANRVRASVGDGINRAGNEGATAVADAAGLPTVWVAETNACVHCLRYSGEVADPGDAFPGGLTYGRKAYHTDAIPTPPRHPHCRCTVEPLHDQSYADALRREADRSILRGFSLESESMAVRIDAADRLVSRGVDAPKSVIAFARRSVKAGEFPTRGRPNGA